MKGCGRGKRLLSKRFPAAGLSFPPCVYKAGSAVRPAGMPVSGWSGERDGGFSRACGVRHEAVLEVAGWKGFSCNKRFLREAFSAPGPFRHTGRDVCRVRKTLRDSRVPGTACRLANGLPGLFHRFHRQSFRFQEIRSRLPFPASRQKREADPGSRLSRNSAAVSSRQPGLFTQMVSCPDCRAARSRESGQAKHRSRGR